MTIREQCKNLKCPHYIEWSFGYGTCYSCELVGQSEDIEQVPDNCINQGIIKS